VADEREPLVAELLHDLDLVVGQQALRVGVMCRVGGQLGAVAVAAKVRADSACSRLSSAARSRSRTPAIAVTAVS
jgi:hypothetical protein